MPSSVTQACVSAYFLGAVVPGSACRLLGLGGRTMIPKVVVSSEELGLGESGCLERSICGWNRNLTTLEKPASNLNLTFSASLREHKVVADTQTLPDAAVCTRVYPKLTIETRIHKLSLQSYRSHPKNLPTSQPRVPTAAISLDFIR
ncbi:hypothetical protein BJ508DRAFT_123567 [Ascobolus immersus RN42]|uniref:Uncharacterized protein n=1 Tax=Ascobolus immersus RN42 TaxID=1160509 RepID=A0A3N4I864_ASCIM|nr:hypothetical protein BJ508DRAFT_123567 [Ascobolus immersus RN42]